MLFSNRFYGSYFFLFFVLVLKTYTICILYTYINYTIKKRGERCLLKLRCGLRVCAEFLFNWTINIWHVRNGFQTVNHFYSCLASKSILDGQKKMIRSLSFKHIFLTFVEWVERSTNLKTLRDANCGEFPFHRSKFSLRH